MKTFGTLFSGGGVVMTAHPAISAAPHFHAALDFWDSTQRDVI